ncbi:MAG: hypothetical protein ACLFUK_08070 [Halanaerobium sp.]
MKRIALGAITNYLNSIHPFMNFIANARAHGYELDRLIICYSHGYKEKSLERLRQTVDVDLIQLNYDPELREELKITGFSKKEIDFFLRTPEFDYYELIPYGKRRNLVLLKALITVPKIDYLFFIDTDVKPRLLLSAAGNTQVINFFGRHLFHLEKENVVVTTSDYSGYYIIPPLKFKGAKELLIGLQKTGAYKKIKNLENNLALADPKQNNIRKTNKILGGNHAVDLHYIKKICPYYSTTYIYNGELYLGRGEDTLMRLEIPSTNKQIIDIDTPIFHDLYGNFPKKPDIKDKNVQKRLFYACTGWLGRNPFLNWYLKKKNIISREKFKQIYKIQKNALVVGAPLLAEYAQNDDFNLLPEIFSAAWLQLDQMVENYEDLSAHWNSVTDKIIERSRKL